MPYKNRRRQKQYQQEHYQRNKSTVRIRQRKWRQENREKTNQKQEVWRKADPIRQLLYYAKYRAKQLRLKFDLTAQDITIPEYCPVLGIKLEYGSKLGVNGHHQPSPYSPSLDRIRPKLGYVKNNVIVVSWRANSLKKDATVQELEALFKFYAKL